MDVVVECGEVGMDTGDRVMVTAAPDEADELDVRVPREEADELAAHVACRADDPDPDTAWPTCRVHAPLGSREEAGLEA